VGGIVGSPGSTSGDSTELKMETKLKAAKSCQVVANVPQMSTDSGSPYPTFDQNYEASLKVSGDTCPMSLSFDFTMQGGQSSLTGKLTGQYQITDADLVAANDVNQASIDGSFSLSGDRSGGSIDANVKGSLVSQKHGNVTFTLTASGSGKSGDIVLDVVFPDFEAKLEQKIDGPDSTYSINGETVTEQEFYSYVQRTGVSARVSGRGAKM
jgi:hypothetical protein